MVNVTSWNLTRQKSTGQRDRGGGGGGGGGGEREM